MTQSRPEQAALACGVLIASVLLVAPNFDVFAGLSYYDTKRLLQIALYGCLMLVLLASRSLRAEWLASFELLPPLARWALGLVLVFGVLSAVLSHSGSIRLAYSLAEVALFAAIAGSALLVATIMRVHGGTAQRTLLVVIVASVGLYLFRFLTRYAVALGTGDPVFVDALFGNFSHIRFIAQWLSWTLPLVVVVAAFSTRRSLRWLSYVTAALWWLLLLVSGTRATMLAITVALVLVPLLAGRPGLKWLQLQLVSAAAGMACYLLGFRAVATLHSGTGLGRLATGHTSGRFAMWSEAWQMIKADPVPGGGPQSYAFVIDHTGSHPHNAALQWAAEWGLPSLVIMTLLVTLAVIRWLQFVRREYGSDDGHTGLLAAGLTGSVLTAAGHSMLSGIIVMPLSQLYLAIIAGWMLFLYQQRQQPVRQWSLQRHIALMLCAMLASLSLLHVALRDVSVLPQITSAYEDEYGILRPRFWQHGRAPVYPPRP